MARGRKRIEPIPDCGNKLIQHMADGLSFESFAGKCGISRETLYQWVNRHKEIADAKKIADVKGLLYFEEMGKRIYTSPSNLYNAAVFIFTLKNRYPQFYSEKPIPPFTEEESYPDPLDDLPKDENSNK